MQKAIVPILVGLVASCLVGFGLHFLMSAAGDKAGPSLTTIGIAAGVGLFAAYIAGNLAGNRSTPRASDADRAAALSFTAPPDQARIYVYREGFIGSAAGLNVDLNGRNVSQLKSPRFLSVVVPPGRHLLHVGFGGLAGAQNNPSELILQVAPGQTVAVRAGVSMGALKNTMALSEQPLDDGLRRKLSRMKMVAVASSID